MFCYRKHSAAVRERKLPESLQQLLDSEKLEEAESIIGRELETNQEDPFLNYWMANVNDMLSREEIAIPYYEKAISNGIEGELLERSMIGLGSSLRIVGKLEESVRILSTAVDRFPDSVYSRLFLSVSLVHSGRTVSGMKELFSVIESNLLDKSDPLYSAVTGYFKELFT